MASDSTDMQRSSKSDSPSGNSSTSQPPGTSGRHPSLPALLGLISSSPEAICFVDRQTQKVTCANEAACKLFGYASHEWETLLLTNLVGEAELCAEGASGRFVECLVRHRNGHTIRVQTCTWGAPVEAVLAIAFRPLEENSPVSEVERDPLTYLPNRRVVEARLKLAIDRQAKDFAVVFLDLDAFKAVNDRFGHVGGDETLQKVAQRLIQCLRPTDTVSRYGGDEFLVLLESIGSEKAAMNASDRLLRELEKPISIQDASVSVSASAGIVLGEHDFANVTEAISMADRAMYHAKTLGHGHSVVFDERHCPSFPSKSTTNSTSSGRARTS